MLLLVKIRRGEHKTVSELDGGHWQILETESSVMLGSFSMADGPLKLLYNPQ